MEWRNSWRLFCTALGYLNGGLIFKRTQGIMLYYVYYRSVLSIYSYYAPVVLTTSLQEGLPDHEL